MRHLFLGRRNYIKPSRPGFKTTTKGKFSVGYTRLKNGNPKFFHFPNFHWYFYEMHQIVIERNREAWIGFLLLFGHWIHFIDFMSIFYLIQIASFVRWGLFSSPFFVIFFFEMSKLWNAILSIVKPSLNSPLVLCIKMVFCYRNCSSDWEKKMKFKAEGWEFAKFLGSPEQFIQTVKVKNNFW